MASRIETLTVQPKRDFRLLWGGNGASNLGDGLYQFILPLLAVQITSTPSLVAGVNVMLTLPWLLFALQAGSLVDRVDRRWLLVLVNAARFALLALLTSAILFDFLSLPLIYAMALVLGIGETLADTALTSIVPATVPPEQLGSANAYITGAQTVTNTFIGPPLAGFLAGLGLALVTSAAGALYGCASLMLGLMRGSFRPLSEQPAASYWQHITEGIGFLWRQQLLRELTLFTAAMNICWSGWTALLVLYSVAPGPMKLDPFAYGLLLTTMAIGGLLGSLACEPIRRRIGTRAALLLDLVGTIALVGVPALTTQPIAVGIAMFIAGFGSAVWVIVVATLRQLLVPDALLGRVYSASRMLSWGVGPLGAVLAGISADIWGIQAVFLVASVYSSLLLFLFLVRISPQQLETGLKAE